MHTSSLAPRSQPTSRLALGPLAAALALLPIVVLSGCHGSELAARGNLSATAIQVVEPAPPAPLLAGHQAQVAITLHATIATEYVAVTFLLVNKADLDASVEEPRAHVMGHAVYDNPPLGTSTHETWVDVPAEIADGVWVLRPVVDPLDQVAEADETDNQSETGPSTVVLVDTTKRDIADLVLESAPLADESAVANEVESKRRGWSQELAQKLNYTNVRDPHFGIDVNLSTSGAKDVHDVPVAVAIEMPMEITLDPPVEGAVLHLRYPVPPRFRSSIPLAIWDGATYVSHKDPGGGFKVPVLKHGDPQAVRLGIALPEDLLQDLNAFIVDYKHWIARSLPALKLVYMETTGEPLPTDTEVKAWYQEHTGQQLETLELTLKVTVNIHRTIREWEAGHQRVASQRPSRDDNAQLIRVKVFERLDDRISNTEPISKSKDFSKCFAANGFSLSPEFSFDAGIDADGATAHSHASLPLELFGNRLELLGIEAKALVDPRDAESSFTADITFFGQVLYTQAANGEVELSIEKSFEKKKSFEKIFTVGPVPLKASIEVGGSIGLEAKLAMGLGKLSLTAGPFASLKVTAALAVTAVVADAGVKGEITLIEIKLPCEAEATLALGPPDQWIKTEITGKLAITVQLEFSGPKGELSLFVKFGVPDFLKGAQKWLQKSRQRSRLWWVELEPEVKRPLWQFTPVEYPSRALLAWEASTTIKFADSP